VDSRTRHLSNQLYLRAEQAKIIIHRSMQTDAGCETRGNGNIYYNNCKV